MGKIKSFAKRNKSKFVALLMGAMMTVTSAVSAFAAEGDSTSTQLTESFSSGVSTMASDITGYIVIAVPVAIGVIGGIFAIKKGISFAKSLMGKG